MKQLYKISGSGTCFSVFGQTWGCWDDAEWAREKWSQEFCESQWLNGIYTFTSLMWATKIAVIIQKWLLEMVQTLFCLLPTLSDCFSWNKTSPTVNMIYGTLSHSSFLFQLFSSSIGEMILCIAHFLDIFCDFCSMSGDCCVLTTVLCSMLRWSISWKLLRKMIGSDCCCCCCCWNEKCSGIEYS